MHVGFTGTRHGMTPGQLVTVMRLIDEQIDDLMIATMSGPIAHHGACVGADAEFHEIALRYLRPVGGRIEVHQALDVGRFRAFCPIDVDLGDVIHRAAPPMIRNQAIVDASQIMIAAPFENVEQRRGGTWATIRMARRSKRTLYIVGREGRLL